MALLREKQTEILNKSWKQFYNLYSCCGLAYIGDTDCSAKTRLMNSNVGGEVGKQDWWIWQWMVYTCRASERKAHTKTRNEISAKKM